MSNDIISSISVDALVAQRDLIIASYDQAVESVQSIHAAISDANERFPIVPGNKERCLFEMPAILVTKSQYDRQGGLDLVRDRVKARESFISMIDAGAWGTLIDASGIRSFMSAKTRKDWDESIYERRTAPFTKDYIESTINDLMGNRVSMMEEGVIDVFRHLSEGFNTNQPQMFGKKIIVSWLWTNYSGGWASVNNRVADELDDLMRVMSIMDGQPAPDHRYGFYSHISDANREKKTTFENEYLAIKWFKKAGTGHVTFKRLDLVEKLNKILAKHFPNAIASDLREKKAANKPVFSVAEEVMGRQVGSGALSALQNATITAVDDQWQLVMPAMERADYQESNRILETLGGKWHRSSKSHVFSSDPSYTIAKIVERGVYLDPRDLGFFPTPSDLVNAMVEAAGLKPGMRVLEPSAGNGAITKAAIAVVGQGQVDCLEFYPGHISQLQAIAGKSHVSEKDFLKETPRDVYDVVLMNPPFSRGQDMMHVQHAWQFVKPGGTLVAIMATGWQTNQNSAAAEFRKFIEGVSDHVVTPQERGIFDDTNVATVMLVLEKPAALKMAA